MKFWKVYMALLFAAVMVGFVLPALFSMKDDIGVFAAVLIIAVAVGAVGNAIFNKITKE